MTITLKTLNKHTKEQENKTMDSCISYHGWHSKQEKREHFINWKNGYVIFTTFQIKDKEYGHEPSRSRTKQPKHGESLGVVVLETRKRVS